MHEVARGLAPRPAAAAPATIIAPSRIQLRAYERVPGCSAAPVARHQDVRERGAQGVGDRLCVGGSISSTRFSRSRQSAATASRRARAQASSARAGAAAAPASGSATATRARLAGRQLEGPAQRGTARPCASASVRKRLLRSGVDQHVAVVERAGHDAVRRRQRLQPRPPVDLQACRRARRAVARD